MVRLSPAPRAGFVYLVGSWGFARFARFTPGFMLSSAPRTKKKLWGSGLRFVRFSIFGLVVGNRKRSIRPDPSHCLSA